MITKRSIATAAAVSILIDRLNGLDLSGTTDLLPVESVCFGIGLNGVRKETFFVVSNGLLKIQYGNAAYLASEIVNNVTYLNVTEVAYALKTLVQRINVAIEAKEAEILKFIQG